MDFKKIKKRLARLDTACICDATKTFRVMDPGIRPLFEGVKMIGLARTVHCRGDFLTVIKALQEAQEDEVLVIDAEGDKIAFAGEMFATEAQRKKLAGKSWEGINVRATILGEYGTSEKKAVWDSLIIQEIHISSEAHKLRKNGFAKVKPGKQAI